MLSDEEFRLFRQLIYDESGIYFKDARKDYINGRVSKRVSANGLKSAYWYYKLLKENAAELLIFLDLLTVNETSFFRNKSQFELFRKRVLPDIIRKKSLTTRCLRIWSAGCSTGEEPYSIAMVVSEALGPAHSWDIKIFASDLSMTVLEHASRGRYEKGKVFSNVEAHLVPRYFSKDGDTMVVREEIRKMIIFDFHNLKNDNGLRDLDVLFCRNVLIYFDEHDQRKITDRFYESLEGGGYLLLGHSESLLGSDPRFEFVYENQGAAYRKPYQEVL